LQQIKAGQRVTGNLLPFTHTEIKVFDDKVLVPLGAIIIFKSNAAYVAIKPISLELKYKSLKEAPKHIQEMWRGEIERGKVPSPIHDLMTYEWKYWPKVIPPNGITAKKPEKKKTWEIASIPIEKEFYIGNIKFFWKLKEPKNQEQFSLQVIINDADKTRYVGNASEWVFPSVSDPSKYNFKDLRHNANGMDKPSQKYGFGFIQSFIIILKIGERDTAYIAIEPVEERRGWIQYKWRYWPSPTQPAELAKTALNK